MIAPLIHVSKQDALSLGPPHWAIRTRLRSSAKCSRTAKTPKSAECVVTPDQIAKLPYRPCVGVMIRNARGEVFVGQRKDNYREAWQMPQGGVDPGEAPRDAALREMHEETGILPSRVSIVAETQEWLPYDLPEDLVGKLWKGKYRGQEQKWFLLDFHGTDDEVNIETQHQEFRAWKWLAPDALVANIVPFKREVYVKVLAAFEDHL